MRLLVTMKPEAYEGPTGSYGVLAEIEWPAGEIVRQVRFPTASFRCSEAFMAPLIGGVCHAHGKLYVAMWNHIVVVDYASFQIIDAFSDPWMADLHGLTTDGTHLWAAATASESVLCFDLTSQQRLWRWGPDAPLLAQHNPHPPSLWQRLQQLWQRKAPLRQEWRHLHKSRIPGYRHHLNDVTYHDGRLIITTKQWYKSLPGAVIQLDLNGQEAHFIAPPGSFRGTHDTEWLNERLYFTEADANGVGWLEADGTMGHKSIEPNNYFVRGLCWSGEQFVVGYTRQRGTRDPALLVGFDPSFEASLTTMELEGFYPPEQGTAIHDIQRSPDGETTL
uniref:Uncharacterized protein n=1 Tax=Magnetococcus massalia (strain MO-1) TaxID=451514 RepID=A0A1S7LQK2_MAGMO|nr:Protein of unknown function. NHL repeat [Candidatus Magnetococcus massalia]